MERVDIQIIKNDVRHVKYLSNGKDFGVLVVDICWEHIHEIVYLEKNLIQKKIDIKNNLLINNLNIVFYIEYVILYF